MLIAARNAMMAGGKPTAKSYVQDGLVAMWDGIENAGWGNHTTNKSGMRELITNSSISVITQSPSVANVIINPDSVDCTRIDYTTRDSCAFLSCQIDGLQDIISSNSTMTIETIAELDTSFQTTYAEQRWGFGIYVGGTTDRSTSANASLRRWWQNATLCASFSGRLYRDLSFGPQNNSSTMVAWQAKRSFCLVAAKNSSPLNAKSYVNGEGPKNSWYDFWNGTTDVGNYVSFGGIVSASAMILPCRIYCIRIYSRALTASEIAANYAVDKARFNLP